MWDTKTVNEIASFTADAPFGSNLKSIDYIERGIPVLQGKNINGRNCAWVDMRFVSQSKFESLPKHQAPIGSLVFPKVGTIGKVGILTPFEGHKNYLLSTNSMCFLPCSKVADKDFIYYYFSSKAVCRRIQLMSSSSVQPVFNFTALRDFPIPLPPLQEQKAIASILSSFDDKIELLRKQNQTLEQIAQTLFKHWFVDFNFPDENGKPYKDSGGKMVPSELGEIPEGWGVENLGDCLETVIDHRGKTPKKLGGDWDESGEVPALSAKNIKNGKIVQRDSIKFISRELYQKWMKVELRPFDILLTSEAPMGEAFLYIDQGPICLSQRLFGLRAGNISPLFLYYYLTSHTGRYLIEARATGSTVQGIRQSELLQVATLTPSSEIQEKFEHITKPLSRKSSLNNQSILNLSALRDLLLPKLISGEIRVKDLPPEVTDV